MPLIGRDLLLQRFEELAAQAKRIDVAVAWARPCDAIEALARAAEGADIRAIVGISGNVTNPTTLRRLNEFAALRVVPDGKASRIFHPKYYCFHGERTICWIGSANLTRGGFGGNNELVHEFELKRKDDRKWFESLWVGLEPDPQPAIGEYEKNYKPPKRTLRPPHGLGTTGPNPQRPSLADIETWGDFIEGLRAYDTYYRHHVDPDGPDGIFDVLGETHSWLHTINTAREIIRRKDWTNLTQRECLILRGKKDDEGAWALLGGVRAGGEYVFNPTNMPAAGSIRMQIWKQIFQVLQAGPNEVATVATGAMMAIKQLKHVEDARNSIGPAAATRWLALARPDCMVSVNKASASGLGKASGLPRNTNGLAKKYADLLAWLHDRRWFKARQPDDPEERDIWNCRAALVDVFVYDRSK